MSSEVQESLNNFKVIVAFNRIDYFRWKFNSANEKNFRGFGLGGFRQQHLHAVVWPGFPSGATASWWLTGSF